MRINRYNVIHAAIIVIPLIIYLIYSLKLSAWIVDDAGISFVYSRNLADGYGFVTQPGMPPVEGFTNFLWVLLMVPFFWFGLFDPIITPKIIGFILVGLTFYLLFKTLFKALGLSLWLVFGVLLCLSINSSFIIWTSSGLENPLYVMLVILLFYLIAKISSDTYDEYIKIGIAASLVALTRPDGIMLFVIFPIYAIIKAVLVNKESIIKTSKNIGIYILTVLLFYGSYFIFRIVYFGDTYPNTYYAKGNTMTQSMTSALLVQDKFVQKFVDLWSSILGPQFWIIVIIAIVLTLGIVLSSVRKHYKEILIFIFLVISYLIYMLLPYDWMKEYRFATILIPFTFIIILLFFEKLVNLLPPRKIVRNIIWAALILVFSYAAYYQHNPRFIKFTKAPTISFSSVAARYAERFNHYSEIFNLTDASLLIPDIGGTLYYSKLRIYDLGGLTDKTIAKHRLTEINRFYDYIFDEIRPTFIHTHGYFTAVSKFDDDPRFSEDYVPISSYADEYVKRNYHADRLSGEFIRKDVLDDKMPTLDSLRQGLIK